MSHFATWAYRSLNTEIEVHNEAALKCHSFWTICILELRADECITDIFLHLNNSDVFVMLYIVCFSICDNQVHAAKPVFGTWSKTAVPSTAVNRRGKRLVLLDSEHRLQIFQ